jgi:hypothetical protein
MTGTDGGIGPEEDMLWIAAVSVLSALYSVVFWFGKLVFWTS